MRVLIVTLVVFLAVAIYGFGQTTGGAVRGVLTDDSGAVIPAAAKHGRRGAEDFDALALCSGAWPTHTSYSASRARAT